MKDIKILALLGIEHQQSTSYLVATPIELSRFLMIVSVSEKTAAALIGLEDLFDRSVTIYQTIRLSDIPEDYNPNSYSSENIKCLYIGLKTLILVAAFREQHTQHNT
jgi:hypothetical protein